MPTNAQNTTSDKLSRLFVRTLVIYDQMGVENIKFFYLKGDYRHLNMVYVNGNATEEQSQELCDLVYDKEGQTIVEMQDSFPDDFNSSADIVIVAGFL